jgi:hypothetical protein
MATDRLALYTTVYPGVEPWLGAWWASVGAQTDRAFDLWIGSDGLPDDAVARAVGARVPARWIFATGGEGGGALRGRVIAAMAAAHAGVVFVDADDVLEPDRVRAARAALAERDVDACALRLVDAAGADLRAVLDVRDGADAAADLPWRNVFGLSNTAYRSALLRRCLPVPGACTLVDWLLATRAWLLGASLGTDPVPRMRYRQHGANVAPTQRPATAAMVASATAHVLGHYACVLDPAWRGARDAVPERRALVVEAHARARTFRDAVVADPARLDAYVEALNALPAARIAAAWWWMVAHPDLEELWRA